MDRPGQYDSYPSPECMVDADPKRTRTCPAISLSSAGVPARRQLAGHCSGFISFGKWRQVLHLNWPLEAKGLEG